MKTRFFGSLFAGLLFVSVAPAQQILSCLPQIPASTADWTGTLDFAGPSGVSFNKNTTMGGAYVAPDLAADSEVGLIDFDVSALARSALAMHGANAADGASTFAAASLTAEFNCPPIPEPATYAASLGLAAFGLVVLRKWGLRDSPFTASSRDR